jgi:5-methylcytosine-specific restriction endonuclease McrA
MPYAPAYPCSHPGCPRLKPCALHAPKPWTRVRPRREVAGSGWARQRLRAAIFQRDGGICRWCRAKPATVLDHVRPVVEGGSDDPSNLVAACHDCNERRRREQVKATRR